MRNRWGKIGNVTDFIFLCSKVIVDVDCYQEIKRHLLLGRKAMANPDKVLKSEHHFADKDLYNLSYGFPVFMYGSESWTIMKAKHRKIDAFKLWYGEDC